MAKILELYKLVKPIFDQVEENKSEIEQLICDIEDDAEIPDEDWDIVDDIGSSLTLLISAFEEFEEQIGESK